LEDGVVEGVTGGSRGRREDQRKGEEKEKTAKWSGGERSHGVQQDDSTAEKLFAAMQATNWAVVTGRYVNAFVAWKTHFSNRMVSLLIADESSPLNVADIP
jgi:hypothetical protein